MSNKLYIFYHVYLFLDWFPIVKEHLDHLKNSKLLDNSELMIGLVYNNDSDVAKFNELISNYHNYKILFIKNNSSICEGITIQEMKKFSDYCIDNEKILYIHTKGVTQQLTENEHPCNNWRRMMQYFLIDKWENCIEKLSEGYDCCGINYQDHAASIGGTTKLIKIFNGNFFWANSDYLKKIDIDFKFEHKYSAENWILSVEHNSYSFYDTPKDINLYKQIYTDYK